MNDRQRSANISSNKKLWLTYRIHTVTRAHIKIQTALGCAEEPIRVLTKTLMALGFVEVPIQVLIKIQMALGFAANTWPEPNNTLAKVYILNRKPLDRQCLSSGFEGN